MKFLRIIPCFLLLLSPVLSRAQAVSPDRAELEERRNQLQHDIEQAQEDLNSVQKNRKETMTQLQLLQNKIRLRNKLIENINQEINYINGDINAANKDIQALQKDLDTLKAQYAQLVVYAYKHRSAYDFLNFVLSANSFNDAIKRFEYLKQYREYRKHQAVSIVATQAQLKQKIEKLAATKKKRSTVLGTEETQREELESEKKEKDEMVGSLRGHEKELLAEISQKKKESQQLSVRIAAVIRREIEEARKKAAAEAAARAKAEAEARARAEEEARKRAQAYADNSNAGNNAPSALPPAKIDSTAVAKAVVPEPEKPVRPTSVLEDTPEALALSESFETNRGKLPWPVARAIVLDPFGVHQHPVLDRITWENDGITLRTDEGASVRAIFDGEVASVFQLSGKWNVMIKHGQYFTVYANLKDVSVQKGDQVKTLQSIGTVYTNSEENDAEMDFKIYKGSTPVNPESWLKSR